MPRRLAADAGLWPLQLENAGSQTLQCRCWWLTPPPLPYLKSDTKELNVSDSFCRLLLGGKRKINLEHSGFEPSSLVWKASAPSTTSWPLEWWLRSWNSLKAGRVSTGEEEKIVKQRLLPGCQSI